MFKKIKLLLGVMVFQLALLVGGAQAMAATPVQTNGALAVSGTKLVSQKTKKPVTLRGVSTHGINWDVGYPYISQQSFRTLRDYYGVNAVRLAMYTTEYYGYCDKGSAGESQQQVQRTLKARLDTGVRAASNLGMYVIVDWHVLNDKNPNLYKRQAAAFFAETAKKYAGYNNIIYEICNEPNGGTSWAEIKSYANTIIPVIRQYDPDAVIVVGTPNWSQDVDVASQSPLRYNNVMYALHFYAATHGASYRAKLATALKNGLPVMVTEYGLSEASGQGRLDGNEAKRWLDYLDQNGISYFAWSLSNKGESASLLSSGTSKTYGWTSGDFSNAGRWVFSQYIARNKAAAQQAAATNKTNTNVNRNIPAQVTGVGLRNIRTRRLVVAFRQVPGATGYQLAYSMDPRFNARYSRVVNLRKNSCILNGMRIGKYYYVKVRAYRYVNGKYYFGPCSYPVRVAIRG